MAQNLTDWLKFLLRLFSSLRLTVICLGLAMLLVFFGTLAQVQTGIHAAQACYFQSLFVFWSPTGATWKIPVLPGGYLLGIILLVNLIAAHAVRFKLSKKKIGIILLHLGVILLLIGQLLTNLFAEESQMRMDEGRTLAYSEMIQETELAIIDVTDSDYDQIVSIPQHVLEKSQVIQHPTLPFTLKIRRFFPNSQVEMRSAENSGQPSEATAGIGKNLIVREIPRTTKDNERDLNSALIEIESLEGPLGIWLVSNALAAPQSFTSNKHTYQLILRQRRIYKPFALTLLDFSHDRYAGTDIPMNFSSRVQLIDLERNENREVLISMNNPLRYRFYTFYQAGFENNDQTSILQVVKNPAVLLPYIACGFVALGLIIQFSMHLIHFVTKSRT